MILKDWPPEDQTLRPYDHWIIIAFEILGKKLYDIDPEERKYWNDCLEAFYYEQDYETRTEFWDSNLVWRFPSDAYHYDYIDKEYNALSYIPIRTAAFIPKGDRRLLVAGGWTKVLGVAPFVSGTWKMTRINVSTRSML